MSRPPAREVVVYGAGGFAREVAWLLSSCDGTGSHPAGTAGGAPGAQPHLVPVGFVDDHVEAAGSTLHDLPVLALATARARFPTATMVIAVGNPHTRVQLAERARKAGFAFETVVHPRVERSPRLEIGGGSLVCAGSILTTDIRIGAQVHVNLDCTIGHDCVIGDFATLAPGVHVSGWVRVGARAFVGTGATIVNGTAEAPLVIGDDAVIGAAACVTRSVAAGETVVGVPARAH